MKKGQAKAFGTFDVARICHVTPTTVGRWLVERKLPSFTTGGGHHRVWEKDLATFLHAHNMPLPPELLPDDALSFLIVDDGQIREDIEKTLRRKFPEAKIHNLKILIISGETAAGNNHSKPIDADGFILKPFNDEDFVAAVKEILSEQVPHPRGAPQP